MSYGKKTTLFSPGTIIQNNIIIEQIKLKNSFAYAVKAGKKDPVVQGSFDLDETLMYPLRKCPWTVASKIEEYDSEKQLFMDIREFVHDHLDVSNDSRYYDIITAWVMADWIQEQFHVEPYLHLHGPPNSGKSRGLEILQSIGYRALLSPSVTSASIYRTIEVFRPTFLLDEAELYGSKGLDDSKREILSVLNAGYRRGQVVIRADQKGENLNLFDVFGFKALAGTRGLAQALESRSVMIRMIKARRSVNRLIDEAKATELRNKLVGWSLYTLATGEVGELSELFSEGVPSLDFVNKQDRAYSPASRDSLFSVPSLW